MADQPDDETPGDDLVQVEIEVHPIDPGDLEIVEPPSADTIIG